MTVDGGFQEFHVRDAWNFNGVLEGQKQSTVRTFFGT